MPAFREETKVSGICRKTWRRRRKSFSSISALRVIPGATHLFEEPGTLQAAAELARDWFVDHLVAGRPMHRARSAR